MIIFCMYASVIVENRDEITSDATKKDSFGTTFKKSPS